MKFGCTVVLVALLWPAWDARASDVTVTRLANEAYLVDDGRRAVLIDAFVPQPYRIYEPLSAATWQAMLAGEPPFDRVVAAVVTHHHRDHFQPDAAAAFLRAQPDVAVFGPPVIESALAHAGHEGKVITALPAYGESSVHVLDGVGIRLLRLRHMPAREKDVEHLGVLIEIGDRRVLHIGDAYPDEANFAPFRLADASPPDLAIVPDWFFAAEWFPEGAKLVAKRIAPRCTLATHVALPHASETLARLRAAHPRLALLPERGGMLDVGACAPVTKGNAR